MKPWPTIRKRNPVVQREFRGINKLDPFSLSDIYATDSKNMSSVNYPVLSVRSGTITLGSVIGNRVLGLGVWKDIELHAIFNDGSWRKWTGSAWSAPLASGLDTSAEWSFTNYKGNLTQISLIATNGVDAVKVYDGTAVTNLTAPAGLKYIEQYADRLYGAVGNDLKFTAYRMANDWTAANGDDADSGFITVETPNGETISGIRASASHITVFKPSSIHELFGTSASDYRMIQVCKGIGMASNKHAVNIGGILYFIDVTNPAIYQYDGGTNPSKTFSHPVQWYMDRINRAGKLSSCIGTDGRNLYVGIPLSGTTPDTILVYDPLAKAWEKWDGFSPLFFARMGVSWYIGDANGSVKQMGIGNYDDGVLVPYRRVSVPYSAHSLSQKIRMNRAWFTATIYTGSTMNIYLSKQDIGDSDWTLVKSITATNALQNVPIYVPTNVVANANWIRYKLEGSGYVEVIEFARDMQSMPII